MASYLEKVQIILSDKNKENSVPIKQEEKFFNSDPKINENNKKNEVSEPINQTESIEPPKEEKKEKIKKKNVILESINIDEKEVQKTTIKKEQVVIEEEKSNPAVQIQSQIQKPTSSNVFASDPNKLNQAKQSAEQLKNMDPTQMKMMTDYFKQMDNSFLKDVMKQQSGVEMSEAELENLKNMMNPDMLKMMSGMNFDNMTMPNNLPTNDSNEISNSTNKSNSNISTPPSMTQNINNLMQNKDMISGLMDNMKKNPEMLKSMGKMLGENHPLAGILNKSSPEDLQKMMTVMQTLIGVVGKISSLIGWMRRNIKLMAFIVIMIIIYYFYF